MQKKKFFLICIIIFIIGLATKTYAIDLLANVNTNELELKKLEVILQVSDFASNPEGINAISGKIQYDSDIFDEVSITGINNWSVAYNDQKGNENEGKFILITTSGNINKDTEIAKIQYVLKPNINNKQTQIKIENIETSYKSEKISIENKTIDLKINENNIEIADSKQTSTNANTVKNYTLYIILAVVILLILVYLIIKSKERRTNEK